LDESWSSSLFTGDQCAVCENPLDDHPEELLDNGELLKVCGACAAKRSAPRIDEADTASVLAEAEARAKTVQELVSCRADEQSRLEEIGQFIENLAAALGHWQDLAAELEQRARGLEAENRRLKDRLARAETLLTQATDAPAVVQPMTRGSHEVNASEEATPPDRQPTPSPTFAERPPSSAPPADQSDEGLTVEEVPLAQKYFNESSHTEKTRSVRRSLGRPVVNLTKLAGSPRQVLITIAWEIVWYQYLVELDEDSPGEERVALFAEGMELQEVNPVFSRPNAQLDDEGRIDASELEFSLISDRSQIIDDLSPEQAVLEDATEEIWDRHSAPEFRWDD
jgi:hypothetical protein